MSAHTDTIPTGIGTATLAEEGVDLIIRNLSTMYTDPLYAVLREWIANAVDSVSTAHAHGEINSTDKTIHITLPDRNNPMLTVTDYGLGMDHSHVFNYALNYGRSSKRGDTITSGKFGLGLKSGLAVANQFTITSVRSGKQTMGFLSLGEADAGVENFCSQPQDTDLPNQTTLSVTVSDNASTANIDTKIARVLGGYDPAMFVVTSPSGVYSLNDEKLHSIFRFNTDLVNLGNTVYSTPKAISIDGNWSFTAIVGGVSYPITEGLHTHEMQINEAITERLAPHNCAQKLRFRNIEAHSIVCPVDGVDIPDNRDTLIFSAKTINTIAAAYVAAILDAQQKAAEYFDRVTVAQAKYDSSNVFVKLCGTQKRYDTTFIMLNTFAPQWHHDAEIIARTNTVLRNRYRDELAVDHEGYGDLDTVSNLWFNTNVQEIVADELAGYGLMLNNDTQPTPGFKVNHIDILMRRHPHNIIKPGESMFIKLDVSDRKTTVTKQHVNGQEYTQEVYLDDKGIEHPTTSGCIAALCKQYRVRINTWRRANQFPTALIGPNPEVYFWEESDFTTIIDFDEFIEQCTTEHRAHLKVQREAKKKKEKTNQQPVGDDVISSINSFYHRGDQHKPYRYSTQRHNNITIQQLEEFAHTHNIAPKDLPIVTVTNGEWNKLSDMISTISFTSPAVEPVVAFLRTTKTNIRKLKNAGFTNIFDQYEFSQHCSDTDKALRDEYFASLSETERTDIGTLIWTTKLCPLLGQLISNEPLTPNCRPTVKEHEDIVAIVEQQFADRGIDVTNNAGYIFIRDVIASAQRGHALLAAHLYDKDNAYVGLDQNDTTTWQFTGNMFDIFTYIQQPATLDQPMEHAICNMLQARINYEYSSAPYVGLFTTAEYNDAYRDSAHKDRSDYTPLERVLFVEDRSQLYDLLVRVFQLNW